jgi:putative ABC transport system permease protein
VAGVLLTATHRAYSDPEALAGGFDIRADFPSGEGSADRGTPEPPAVSGSEDFVARGRLAQRPGQLIETTDPIARWRPAPLVELDAGFAAGLRSPLAERAAGLASDAQVWERVLGGPGFAVVAGPTLGAGRSPGSWSGGFGWPGFIAPPASREPRVLWVRDERGGRAIGLEIVGALDPRVALPAGVYTSAASFSAARAPEPQRVSYYLKARPEADPRALALALNLELAPRGGRASAIGEEVRQIQTIRELLNQLLQGFFAIGLLAGLAALGVTTMRAVVERRQQIGVLRALGFRRGMVRLSLLLELSLIALLGIGIGTLLGLALAQRLVEHLGRQYPEIVFGVPWGQLGVTALGAYVAALALSAIPLWQIGRVEPAEALRYE